jgi:hypothetical protein
MSHNSNGNCLRSKLKIVPIKYKKDFISKILNLDFGIHYGIKLFYT